MQINIATRASPDLWQECSEVVRSVYRRAYSADVAPEPDYFIAVRSTERPGAEVVACAGLTLPRKPRFFAEQYLAAEVTDAIAAVVETPVSRECIVEVGPLASRVARSGIEAARITPIIAWCMGFKYILCTATPALITMLDRLGIDFVPLAPASIEALPEAERKRWGSYYDQQPRTGFISIARTSTRLFERTTGHYQLLGLDISMSVVGLASAAGAT